VLQINPANLEWYFGIVAERAAGLERRFPTFGAEFTVPVTGGDAFQRRIETIDVICTITSIA
jgi:hypothetical protein